MAGRQATASATAGPSGKLRRAFRLRGSQNDVNHFTKDDKVFEFGEKGQ